MGLGRLKGDGEMSLGNSRDEGEPNIDCGDADECVKRSLSLSLLESLLKGIEPVGDSPGLLEKGEPVSKGEECRFRIGGSDRFGISLEKRPGELCGEDAT